MKRTILNLFALSLILGGAARLQAQEDRYCCYSADGDSCCGKNGCSSGSGGCSGW